MEGSCAYCGDEVIGDGVKQDSQLFCCQECLDAYNGETLSLLEDEEIDG